MSALSVDAGTSVVKAVVYDDDGTQAGLSRRPVPVSRPRPGWAEQDMTSVWDAVAAVIRDVLPQAPSPVRFLAITAQGDGCWLVGPDGAPTGPAILWSDGRAGDTVESWREAGVLEQAFRINGSLTFSGLPNAILTWLAAHDPDRVHRSAAALTCGGWLYLKCTGEVGAELADASAPFLDPRARRYAPELLRLYDLEWAARLLPEVRPDPARSAPLTADAASQLGLPAGLPVVMAPYDVASTALGVGAVEPGQVCTILGTTLCTEMVSDIDTSGEPSGLTVVRGPGDQVLRVFPTLAGTEVLDWAADLLGVAGPSQLADLAAAAAPGARGLTFLPYVSPAGERAPFLNPYAKGVFWGLSLGHGRAEIARAVFEGLSMVIRDCVEAFHQPAAELRVCGGGANSDLWRQLIADVVGAPVTPSADVEAGARGAYLSGLVATGVEPSIAAAARHVRAGRSSEPDPRRVDFYTARYQQFRLLREISAQGWSVSSAAQPAPRSTVGPPTEGRDAGTI